MNKTSNSSEKNDYLPCTEHFNIFSIILTILDLGLQYILDLYNIWIRGSSWYF